MRLKAIVGLFGFMLAVGYVAAQSSNATERTVRLERFGFKTGSCEDRQVAHFLDDERLVLSAPMVVCDKSNSSKALQTRLTVVDLKGTLLATKLRPDVYAIRAGPIGSAVVCTESSIELISPELVSTRILLTHPSKGVPCSDIDGLSPSRTAISIREFGESPESPARHQLFRADSELPIAEQLLQKRDHLAGVSESGFAVCKSHGHNRCEQLTVDGSAWTGVPTESVFGLFLSPNQLLLRPVRTEKELIALSPDGKQERVVNLHGLQPPNVDGEGIEISANIPRRILYSAEGCYIGDFDDCYALAFRRIILFDPQTNQALFKATLGRNTTNILSPDGRTVVVLDKTKLHIYTVP